VLDIIAALDPDGQRYRCIGFLDDDERRHGSRVAGLPILGPLSGAPRWPSARFVDAIGSPRTHRRRLDILNSAALAAGQFETLIHPQASISPRARIDPGAVLYPNVVVGPEAVIGAHVTILANTVVSHGAQIGEYSLVASNVTLSGDVCVGRLCYVGAGSHVRERVTIADGSLVGLGAVVVHDVGSDRIVVGNPARELRRHDAAVDT